MSLLEREAGQSMAKGQETDQRSYTEPVHTDSQQHIFSPAGDSYDDAIVEFYTMDSHVEKAQSVPVVPALPPRSALRASKMLDLGGRKLGGSMEKTTALSHATPHEMYLSSEEDASSSADDFSDYDYDSSSEAASSPRRKSHEDTARIVSLVYYGKPIIVDLPLPRRSISPSSSGSLKRTSTISSVVRIEAVSITPSSSTSSLLRPTRTSSLASSLMLKKKPTFLNMDPYGNGSTYSLDETKEEAEEESKLSRTVPRTPTAIFKGVSRTMGLIKKKSQPVLMRALESYTTVVPEVIKQEIDFKPTETDEQSQPPMSPSVTYQDILMAAKKNSIMVAPSPVLRDPRPQSPWAPASPISRRGLLSGLAGRRGSVKLAGKVI